MDNVDHHPTKDKCVVISGATKGLGRALSLEFTAAGYEVIGIYRSNTDAADALTAELAAKNLRGSFIKQNIIEDGEWTQFDSLIQSKRGKHSTLIANACPTFVPKPFHLIDWREFSEQIEVNVKGSFNLFKRLLPEMAKSRQGTIVSVLTRALDAVPKGFAAYLTAKYALEGLTKSIAVEYAQRGIRVFSVSPGFMKTAMTENWSEHLKNLICAEAEAQSPTTAAQEILALINNSKTIGYGENYLLGESGKKLKSRAAQD